MAEGSDAGCRICVPHKIIPKDYCSLQHILRDYVFDGCLPTSIIPQTVFNAGFLKNPCRTDCAVMADATGMKLSCCASTSIIPHSDFDAGFLKNPNRNADTSAIITTEIASKGAVDSDTP